MVRNLREAAVKLKPFVHFSNETLWFDDLAKAVVKQFLMVRNLKEAALN